MPTARKRTDPPTPPHLMLSCHGTSLCRQHFMTPPSFRQTPINQHNTKLSKHNYSHASMTYTCRSEEDSPQHRAHKSEAMTRTSEKHPALSPEKLVNIGQPPCAACLTEDVDRTASETDNKLMTKATRLFQMQWLTNKC